MTNQGQTIASLVVLTLAVGALLSSCGDEGSAKSEDKAAADTAVADTAAADAEAADTVVTPDVPKGPPVLVCSPHNNCEEEFCDQVLIKGGEFNMGTENEPNSNSLWPSGDARPIHLVQVDTFCIDRYEVSLERYESCVDAGACSPEGLKWGKTDSLIQTTVNHYPEHCYENKKVLPVCKNLAVNGKTSVQAKAYCAWIGGRLCTEAEWERAANGPGLEQRAHPWGNDPPTTKLVNIKSVGPGYIEPVDSHGIGKSVEGVYNLAGNVYEWTSDAYLPYKQAFGGGALDNPSNPPLGQQEMIGRGSCFFTEPTHTVTDRTVFAQIFDWG